MTSGLPRVVRQWAQPTSGSGPKAAKAAKEAGLPPRAATTSQQIGFFGHTIFGQSETFTVLAGEGAPTITEGWPKFAKVMRHGRVALTVLEGYEPIEMTVPILFDAIAVTKNRPDIEADVKKLEWMAGRSSEPTEGEPPLVEIYSTDNQGNPVALVPKQYQTSPGLSQQWYISAIAFDTNPIRDKGGARIRQLATVTLTEYVASPSALRADQLARESVKGKFKTVKSSESADTIKKVARREGIPAAWAEILSANKNLGTSAEKKLRSGTKIKIPLTAYRRVPK